MATENKKVMVFGVFDNLHDGHRFFLKNALLLGNELYIVVTPTQTVQKIKGKLPFYSIKERMQKLSKEYPDARIIEGDTDSNVWTPILTYAPDVVVCGYDQTELHDALSQIKDTNGFELQKINQNFQGETVHSRFLNKSV